jgi:Mg2+ and Co2+ transporter CorA
MAVGKAEARPPDRASATGFTFVVPCFSTVDEAAISDHLARDHFFWLDLTAPTRDDIEKLRELFGFHPLAVEDALHFGQRPKLDHYQDYIFLVSYGARDQAPGEAGLLQEVQMFMPCWPVLSSTTDLYLSTVSNRQNEVMKQLAIVGTIFLPLSFITGFFGMNFGWLVGKGITATWSFFVLGLGSLLITCVFLLRFFKRKGWM